MCALKITFGLASKEYRLGGMSWVPSIHITVGGMTSSLHICALHTHPHTYHGQTCIIHMGRHIVVMMVTFETYLSVTFFSDKSHLFETLLIVT